jgi:hypothetical protein
MLSYSILSSPSTSTTYIYRRFTVTTDSSVEKSSILEEKSRTRLEGMERRRSRRLRRQLEAVSAGRAVSGFVQGAVNEGVLVTVTSLGR